MGADSIEAAIAVAALIGVDPSAEQLQLLAAYENWLRDEALAAGGIGPDEGRRLWDRHIADSIAFGLELEGTTDCLDIGTGVGLPGVPLAILFPGIEFTLLDRSGKRCDLVRRAVRILQLPNCVVRQQDIESVGETYSAVVSRAAIPVAQIMIHVKRLLRPGGVAILGVTRQGTEPKTVESLPGLITSPIGISSEVLDRGANLLRIRAT